MTFIPSNLGRVPNLLSSQLVLSNLTRTNLSMLGVQNQLATGRMMNKVSDDAVKAAAILELNNRIDRSDQLARNVEHATASLNMADKALEEIGDTGQEARSIAGEQVGIPSDGATRSGQAVVVQSLLSGLFNSANRTGVAGYIFGGATPGRQPYEELLGGYRYTGEGKGLVTDLGLAQDVPITLGAIPGLGGTSARVRGDVDLNPSLTPSTRLSDLAGARSLGVKTGTVEFSFNNGARTAVDLSGADTAQDVINAVTNAIHAYETQSGTTVLGPGGVSISGGSLAVDVAPGTNQLQFFDVAGGTAGADLGLVTTPAPLVFGSGVTQGLDLMPRLTWRSPVSSMAGLSGGLGSILIRNGSGAATVDLSQSQTLEDIKNSIEGSNLGVRVEINASGSGIDVYSELAAGEKGALSIEEVPGSNLTATRLGIRSLSGSTLLSDFNFGRGVQVVDGAKDPVTGLPDPSRDVDFVITLGDAARTQISIDLKPQDVVSVKTLTDAVNAQAAAQLAAAGLPSTALIAGLSNGTNGITLTQDASFGSALTVTPKNNSQAAEQLGLTKGTYVPGGAALIGEDRAKVRVDGLFSDLIDLRNALEANDTFGIGVAQQRLGVTVDQVAQTRATVGGYSKRVEFAGSHQEERTIVDKEVRSQLQDLDFAEAATRYSLLQTQLTAGLQVGSRLSQQSLLDFLG